MKRSAREKEIIFAPEVRPASATVPVAERHTAIGKIMPTKGWIFLDNLKPFASFLADCAKYDLSDGELWAIECGVEESDYERNSWYEYSFGEADSLKFRLAYDRGSSVMFYEVEASEQVAIRLEHVAEIMGEYTLKGGRFTPHP
jgi:hypothetical protein